MLCYLATTMYVHALRAAKCSGNLVPTVLVMRITILLRYYYCGCWNSLPTLLLESGLTTPFLV